MTTYSFRAECERDVEEIKKALTRLDSSISLVSTRSYLQGSLVYELFVEFTSELDLGTIQKAVAYIEDCHVALQTLRAVPLSKNSLERDRSIW